MQIHVVGATSKRKKKHLVFRILKNRYECIQKEELAGLNYCDDNVCELH